MHAGYSRPKNLSYGGSIQPRCTTVNSAHTMVSSAHNKVNSNHTMDEYAPKKDK